MKLKDVVVLCLIGVGCFGIAFAGEDRPIRIGITQIVKHPAVDATRKGFMDDLDEHGFPAGKRVDYDYKNVQNNRAVSGQIAREFVGDRLDPILAISTPSAQDAAAATKEIPIFLSPATDPASAGFVKALDSPGGNFSGTTDRSPTARQIDLILEILPSVKRLGTIFNPGEVNSVISVKELEEETAKRGIMLAKAPATSSSAVKMAAESLVGKVDAVHVPADKTVVLAIESVVRVCQENKIPLFAGDGDSVARGGVAALAVDYYQLGRQTSAMARKVLEGKGKVSELPVEHQQELLLHLNPGQAAKMGVKLSDAIVRKASKIVQ